MNILITCFFILFSINAWSETSDHQEYLVKKGDSIGEILFSLNISPLWGPKGNVVKTIRMNPTIIDAHGRILENTVILIPKATISRNISTDKIETVEKLIHPESRDEEIMSSLSVTTGLHYYEIKAIDKNNKTHARLDSKLSQSALLAWNIDWSKESSTYIFGGAQRIKFNNPINKGLHSNESLYGEFGMGHNFKWSNLGMGFEVKNKQVPYLRGKTVHTLQVETPWLRQWGISIEKDLIKKKSGALTFKLAPYYSESKKMSDFNIKSGYGGRVELKAGLTFKHLGVDASYYTEFRRQDTSITKQDLKQHGVMIQFNIPFGDVK